MIRQNPASIVHLSARLYITELRIREKTNANVAPKAINIEWKLVNVPEISIGESSFIIKGAIELNNPVQYPWSSLAITKNSKLLTTNNKVAPITMVLTISKHVLKSHNKNHTFLRISSTTQSWSWPLIHLLGE